MLLIWNRAGRAGPYKATAEGAWYFDDLISASGMLMKHDRAKANREFCQRHAWRLKAIDAIECAIGRCGVSEIAYAIKVDSSRVSKWRRGVEKVPAKHCEAIAKLCRNFQTPESYRPDLEFYKGAGPGLSWRKRSLTVGGAES